jgi:hypothetical protein
MTWIKLFLIIGGLIGSFTLTLAFQMDWKIESYYGIAGIGSLLGFLFGLIVFNCIQDINKGKL